MIRTLAIIAALVTLDAQRAYSAPPAVGSEAWEIMHPYADWIGSTHDAIGRLCCDVSDARPVEVRQVGNKWEVRFITPDELPAPPPVGWQRVPDIAVLRDASGRLLASPVGISIAWWWQGEVRCFVAPGGV